MWDFTRVSLIIIIIIITTTATTTTEGYKANFRLSYMIIYVFYE